MNPQEKIIFLTDKYGKRDKTSEIQTISFNPSSRVWEIIFLGNSTVFHYKRENVQIVKNCLNDKNSSKVFDYLLQMAQFSDITNNEGENLLVKNLEKSRFINEESVLAKYLNPKFNNADNKNINSMIFPFGCNNSQFKAVKTALNNQVSIIQGPPGTGKTQTILNIIANLLVNKKTVLVVSNNNDATANVYEKLASEKYKLDFICAAHGKKKNIDDFLTNQKQFYPEYLKDWKNLNPISSNELNNEVTKLGKYFAANERISAIHQELSALEIEKKYFEEKTLELYESKKNLKTKSDSLMKMLQEILFVYSEKEKISFFKKYKLKKKFGIGEKKFWNTDVEKAIDTIKKAYYILKTKELNEELLDNQELIKEFVPEKVYKNSLDKLRLEIASKYLKNNERIQFKDGREIYFNPAKFASEYPVVLSTTFSSRATIGKGTEFLFDYVIMDEASQVDVVTGALALSCAKNAVIVGDKMQLPNVIEDSKKKNVQELFNKTGFPKGYNFINSFLASVELVLPDTPQTLLREHYRCHPKIINFCNQQFYGGKLLIMTEDKGEADVLEAIKTVPGNFCNNHYNQRQIDVIKNEILPKYSDDEKESLGIIAPYNNQIDAIHAQIPGVDAATVHKYQGREKDNIIISTVDNEITTFADDSNMLNVAISRAKKKLAVVISGNQHPENSNLTALIKYIQYNNFQIEESKVSSIFDFFFAKSSAIKLKYLAESKKISKFDSENAMAALLTKIFNESDYAKYGFVFEMPLKDFVSKTSLNELPFELAEFAKRSWSHVDFTIYNKVTKEILIGIEVDGYTYHKTGTVQSERDKKKNAIFELIGIPLLRFNTKGSGEEQKIKECLMDLKK